MCLVLLPQHEGHGFDHQSEQVKIQRCLSVFNGSIVTSDGGKVGWRRHGQHRRGDVFGLDPIFDQPVQVWCVHVLVIVPSKAIEGDQQELVPGHLFAQRLPSSGEHSCTNQEELQPRLHPQILRLTDQRFTCLRWSSV